VFYTTLGATDLKVSQIGFGTWQWGDKWWGWGKDYAEHDVVGILRRGLELGVNFVDTAEIYGGGISEQMVGKAVKDIRDQIVIATKVSPTHATYNGVLKACERSLKRLGIKTIDLYQYHWPNPVIPISQTMRAMEKLVEQGKIRYIGISNFSLKQLIKAEEALKREVIVSNQVKYNMLERGCERELLPYARKRKVTIIAYSPLAQGVLTGKYTSKNRPRDPLRKLNILFDPQNLAKLEPLQQTLNRIAEEKGKSTGQIALNWLIKDPSVMAIPGVKSLRQAEENAGAGDFRLDERELRLIEEVYSQIKLSRLGSMLRIPLRLLSP